VINVFCDDLPHSVQTIFFTTIVGPGTNSRDFDGFFRILETEKPSSSSPSTTTLPPPSLEFPAGNEGSLREFNESILSYLLLDEEELAGRSCFIAARMDRNSNKQGESSTKKNRKRKKGRLSQFLSPFFLLLPQIL
jgi:hypothetical protein